MTTPARTEEFVAPAYEDRALGDVLPAVCEALGLDAGFHTSSFSFPPADRYLVFLVDGLGYELLRDHPVEAPFLHSLLDGHPPGTVGVPSTTATSITSLGTALTPGRHGVVGYTTRIPGTDRLLNALAWDPSVDAHQWQPHPTAFARIAAAGATSTVVNRGSFADTGLTLAGQRGADFVGVDRAGERVAAALSVSRRSPSLTYLYDGDLDWTGHKYGVDSEPWRQQLSLIDLAARHLRATVPAETRIVFVADHGMVDCPAADRLDVDEHVELRDGLVVLGGEARFRHLYCRDGAVDDVLATWSQMLGRRAVVLTREDAAGRGWFGPLDDAVRPRLGDVMVASRGTFAVQSTSGFPLEARLVGMHGSLTSAEMLIPVLVA